LISAIHGPIADTKTDISQIFKSCCLLNQKYNAFYALPFLRNSKIRIYELKIFQIAAISIFCYDF